MSQLCYYLTQFMKNRMSLFCGQHNLQVYDTRNAIALRADIHQLFDDGSFVYVPKSGEMRLHFLSASWAGPHTQYQNSLFSTRDISFQLLYARFAWAVFKKLNFVGLTSCFDTGGKPRGDADAGKGGEGEDVKEEDEEDSDTGLGKRE